LSISRVFPLNSSDQIKFKLGGEEVGGGKTGEGDGGGEGEGGGGGDLGGRGGIVRGGGKDGLVIGCT
jgi:hypothetical protein